MKKLSLVLLITVVLAGGAVAALSAPSHAQFYEYSTPPPNPYAQPWVGSNTPWTYFNGDWFLNGLLYYFFGPQYGWCPYYTYAPIYIVRPSEWYVPQWQAWYKGHPNYWEHFRREYPYWRTHRVGQRYDERFYEKHHHGQPGAWQKGFPGRPAPPVRPEGQRPGPGHVAPPAGPGQVPGHVAPPPGKQPEPGHFGPPAGQQPSPPRKVQPEGQRPGPGPVTPPAGQRPPSPQVAPPAGPRPGPTQVSPPAATGPAPARVAPPTGPKPAPGQVSPPAGQTGSQPAPAPQPEKGHQGEERH